MKKFDNKERHRYYGVRVGDIVELEFSHKPVNPIAEVIEYGFMDNNSVFVRMEDGTETGWVAEHCKVIIRIEEIELTKWLATYCTPKYVFKGGQLIITWVWNEDILQYWEGIEDSSIPTFNHRQIIEKYRKFVSDKANTDNDDTK